MNSILFDLEPNTFLFFLVERICSNNIESEKRAHILQVYSSNKITCVTMLRIVRGVCIKSVQNFVLARLEKIYKKILLACAVMQRCFDLEVSAGENCPFHLSFFATCLPQSPDNYLESYFLYYCFYFHSHSIYYFIY